MLFCKISSISVSNEKVETDVYLFLKMHLFGICKNRCEGLQRLIQVSIALVMVELLVTWISTHINKHAYMTRRGCKHCVAKQECIRPYSSQCLLGTVNHVCHYSWKQTGRVKSTSERLCVGHWHGNDFKMMTGSEKRASFKSGDWKVKPQP